ncbi:hypothetical protein E4U17_002171 [Claviceps sp. LM77 group G4]|nr:hypothetical protein E4U17_002171 [Claviceps sp. LM77 group G4]KAG6075448.1 hypothetical protein E4U33_002100 [Claviceps sp. LM78 group G4]
MTTLETKAKHCSEILLNLHLVDGQRRFAVINQASYAFELLTTHEICAMSAAAPQILLRKASGTSNATVGQPSDQANVRQRKLCPAGRTLNIHPEPILTMGDKASTRRGEANGSASKSGKGKGAVDQQGPSKNANEEGAAQEKSSRSKAQNEGEKLVIRRLPPGMTEQELVTILGPDWEVNGGKVDWSSYVPGKISTDPSKPSRPSRAYLHLTRKDDIMSLSEVVRNATWEDAKATFNSSALVGPPVLEFSLYKKIGATKKRTDARQGTIDQDPEFMAFLEDLANPAPMRESIDVEDPNDMIRPVKKLTITPLVEYLREKKANKGKDSGPGKNSKSVGKGRSGLKDDDTSNKKKGKDSKTDKSDKSSKETVKTLIKKAATDQTVEVAKKVASQTTAANPATNTSSTITSTVAATGNGANVNAASSDMTKTRRAGIAAAARILQRDLGLSPGSAHRRARHDAAKAGGDAQVAVASANENESKAKASLATVPTVAERSSPPSETPLAQTSKARPESPAVTKSQSGRRNRGGRNADKSKAAVATETVSTTAATLTAQPLVTNNTPIILKKRNDAAVTKAAENQLSNQAPSLSAPGVSNSTSNGNCNGNSNGNSNSNSNGNVTKQGPREKGNTKSAQKKAPLVATKTSRAFVKHVSASQGVTNETLKEALGAFGAITLVDIDKRKSFAYVDFSDHDALAKAIAASPLVVGQGSVQVLERKDKKPAATAATPVMPPKEDSAVNGEKPKASSAGRGRRGRGGGRAAASKEAPAPASTGG